MYVDIPPDDPTPVGTMTLCLICDRALICELHSYQDPEGGRVHTVSYRAWKHVVHWPGGWHDPVPAVSSR